MMVTEEGKTYGIEILGYAIMSMLIFG